MTDQTPAAPPPAAGATDIANAPLTDPVVAAQRMEQLKGDPKFMEKVGARDPGAFDLYNKAWRVAHGLPEIPQPPESLADVEKEQDARVTAAFQQHAGFYRDRGYTEQQQKEIVGQRFITTDEKRWHETQYNMKRNSPAFMAKWSAGDLEAVREMNNHAIARGLPVGTLEDIARWEGKAT